MKGRSPPDVSRAAGYHWAEGHAGRDAMDDAQTSRDCEPGETAKATVLARLLWFVARQGWAVLVLTTCGCLGAFLGAALGGAANGLRIAIGRGESSWVWPAAGLGMVAGLCCGFRWIRPRPR